MTTNQEQLDRLLDVMFRINRQVLIMQNEAHDVAEDLRRAPCRCVSPYPDNDNAIIPRIPEA